MTELDEAELECFDFDIIVVLVDDDDESGVGETGSNAWLSMAYSVVGKDLLLVLLVTLDFLD